MPDDLREALAKLRRSRDDAKSEAIGAKEKLLHALSVTSVDDLDVNRVAALADDLKLRMARHDALDEEYERWLDLV